MRTALSRGADGRLLLATGAIGAAAAAACVWLRIRRRATAAASASAASAASTANAAEESSWGLFCSALPNGFALACPSCLLIIDGKIPVASKGPIAWLPGEVDDVLKSVSPSVRAGFNAVPVGVNAVAIDLGAGSSSTASHATNLLTSRYPQGFKMISVRELLFLLPARASAGEVEAVVRAVSLLAWHRSAAYSGADGTPTSFAPNTQGRRRKLAGSGRSLYPRVDPVAIVLCVSADGDRLLLGRQSSYPKRMFTCVSGFVEHGESAERAAAREVLEETGVKVGPAALLASQPWPCGRGSSCELMLGVVVRAIPGGEGIDVTGGGGGGGGGGGELEDARWFDRTAVAALLAARAGDDTEYVPPAVAIAHHLIARWSRGAVAVPDL